jgi:hypothetical protein
MAFLVLARKWRYTVALSPGDMMFRFLFKRWPVRKQVAFLKSKGVLIGSRTKEARKIFIYMYQDLFAEVSFRHDDPNDLVESANIVKGLENLNTHLEKEFKTSF